MHKSEQLLKDITFKEKQMHQDFYRDFSQIRRYITTDFSLSHHQSLELLNDLADHILESQTKNTTAQQFFGDNLEVYTDELVSELSEERKIIKTSVIAYAVCNILALLLVIIMVVELFVSFTSSGHYQFYPFALITAFITFIFASLGSLYILLKLTHLEEFKANRYSLLKELPIYVVGGITIFGSQMIYKNMKIGPNIHLDWYVYLIMAVLIAVIGAICSNKIN